MAKKKKQPKVEKVFNDKSEEQSSEIIKNEEESVQENAGGSDVDDILGIAEENPEDKLTEKQKAKLEKINNVKNKISKILKTSNIEIVDENFDDDYDYGSRSGSSEQSQQDYDALKALFGDKNKGKQDELTLTIDDFDYTYIGQYLEEYDLLHMKNIKKVKIIRKRSPKLKKFLIASLLVVVISVGAVLGFLFTRPEQVYLKSVSLNQTERVYYLNDKFEDTGLYFIAQYSNGTVERIKLTTSYYNSERSTGIIDRSGEDNEIISFNAIGSANLVFSYQGFDVEYAVTVTRKVEKGVHAFYTEKIFNIPKGDSSIISNKILTVLAEYDGEEETPTVIDFSDFNLYVDGIKCTYTDAGFVVKNGTASDSVIIIEHGNYRVTLSYGQQYI